MSMSLGFNVSSYNNAVYKNRLHSNVSFGAQNASVQNTTQAAADVQNPPQKSGKLGRFLLGAALIAAGSIATVIVYKIKGKTPADPAKAVNEAAEAVSEAVNKVETSADGADKPGLIQRIKEKAKAFFGDIKKGFNEHKPASETSDSASAGGAGKSGRKKKGQKPAGGKGTSNPNPADVLNTTMAARVAGVEGITSSFEKISADLDDFVQAAIQANNDSVKVLNNTALENWAAKAIGDFSSAASSSVDKAGFGKVNAFYKTDADSWQYFEGFSQSLGKRTSRVQRRISVTPDEIKVGVSSAKDKKKNIETVEELFKFNRNADTTEYFTGYKVSPEGIEYSKGLTSMRGASVPETVTEGYKKLSDGTVKIKRLTENGTGGTYGMIYEDVQRLTDGTEIYGKMVSYDNLKPELYAEGYTKNPDGSFEALKEFYISSGSYYEASKVAADGSQTAQRKIQLDASKRPLAYFEDYSVDAAGVESAKVKIEYDFATGKPKYCYEDYVFSEADGEKYSSKAKFKDGRWVKV